MSSSARIPASEFLELDALATVVFLAARGVPRSVLSVIEEQACDGATVIDPEFAAELRAGGVPGPDVDALLRVLAQAVDDDASI
jgi:hypothetical protein